MQKIKDTLYKTMFEKVLLSIGEIEADRNHPEHYRVFEWLYSNGKRSNWHPVYVKHLVAKRVTESLIIRNIADTWRSSSTNVTKRDLELYLHNIRTNIFKLDPVKFVWNAVWDSAFGKCSPIIIEEFERLNKLGNRMLYDEIRQAVIDLQQHDLVRNYDFLHQYN